VQDVQFGRVARALRRRRGWRQADVAARAGAHRSTISLIERGQLDSVSMTALRRSLAALEVRLDLVPRWRGSDLDRLLDEDHQQLQAAWKARLDRWSWLVNAEASFNHYGDRGRIDLLAWHPLARIILVVEVKTLVVDAQDLLGSLDVKVRVAPFVARERGWPDARGVVPVLVLRESATNRRRLVRLGALADDFDLRGRAAVSWLRHPSAHPRPGGLLILSDLSPADHRSVRRVGRERVRLDGSGGSVESATRPPLRRP
jgi:transcriptional regulator with XRE-family HTH domain